MSEFTIRVTETLSRLVTVDTLDADDAIAMVQEQWDNEEIVLDETDFDGNVEFEVE